MVKLEDAVIAKLEKAGHKFELLVDSDLALDVKHGKEFDVEELLAVDKIFKDAKAGDVQSDEIIHKALGSNDLKECVKKIVQQGEVQLTTEQRRALKEKKRLEIITFITRNAINPQTKTPHPQIRIENAMEQAKIHIDEFKSAEEQIEIIVKAIRPIIPISMEKIDFAIKVPARYSGKANSIIHRFEIKKEEWLNDGSLVAEFVLPVRMKQDLLNELNAITHGEIDVKMLETKS